MAVLAIPPSAISGSALYGKPASPSLALPTDPAPYSSILFPKVFPTRYFAEATSLCAEVKASASALILPLTSPFVARGIAVHWRGVTPPNVLTVGAEQSRSGDDFAWRIGLLRAGPPPLIPWFAPGWLRMIRDLLPLSADRLTYYVIGARHQAGATWKSPYSDSVDMVAVGSEPLIGSRENIAEVAFPATPVVGVWLMADGDNSKSEFTSCVSAIEITGELSGKIPGELSGTPKG